MSKLKRHAKVLLAAVIAAGTLTAAVGLAEDVWINAQNVEIRSGKGAIYPVIASAPKGTKLTVLAHEGKWFKVQAKDQQGNMQEGYVFESAVSTDEVGGGGNLLANMGAGANASDMSTGAAGKGLNEEAEDYSHGKNMDSGPMNRLVDFRKHLDPKLWEKFTAEGKVGPDAPTASAQENSNATPTDSNNRQRESAETRQMQV